MDTSRECSYGTSPNKPGYSSNSKLDCSPDKDDTNNYFNLIIHCPLMLPDSIKDVN